MRYTFVSEVPVAFGITVEADSLEDAVAQARACPEVKILGRGEGDYDLRDIWCTSVESITEDVRPGDGELTDFHQGTGFEVFAELESLWGRTV